MLVASGAIRGLAGCERLPASETDRSSHPRSEATDGRLVHMTRCRGEAHQAFAAEHAQDMLTDVLPLVDSGAKDEVSGAA